MDLLGPTDTLHQSHGRTCLSFGHRRLSLTDVSVFRWTIDVSLSIPSLILLGPMDTPHQSHGRKCLSLGHGRLSLSNPNINLLDPMDTPYQSRVFHWAMDVSVSVVPEWTSLVQ